MKEIGFFLQYDLGETIDMLKTAQDQLETKTTPAAGTAEVEINT